MRRDHCWSKGRGRPSASFQAGSCTAKDAGFGLAGFRFDPPIHGYLRDRERLAGAPDWEVLATPGHTDCSTCLWNAKTRTLLTGDTVLSIHGRAWFNPEYVDAEASARTEAMLRRLPVEHLLPGHGHPVSGPRVMAEALSHRERPRGWSIPRRWRSIPTASCCSAGCGCERRCVA